jgi:signal transduction histidine kinase
MDLLVETSSGALEIVGHRQLLAQAVSNLIENGLKYGAEGGVMTLAAERIGDRVIIEVRDRGPGIPEELRGAARKRFVRLDSSRSASGAGLGLTLVEAIAHLHRGELVLDDCHPGLRAAISIPEAT